MSNICIFLSPSSSLPGLSFSSPVFFLKGRGSDFISRPAFGSAGPFTYLKSIISVCFNAIVQADLTKLAAVDSTAAELNIVDGGTSATSTTLVDADRFVVNDNGTMVQVAASDLITVKLEF